MSVNIIMKFGDKSDYVTSWQKFLVSKGFLTAEPTGYFGEKTLAATIEFQRRYGLKDDGIVGNNTINKAKEFGFRISSEIGEVNEYQYTIIDGTPVIAAKNGIYMKWTAGASIDADGGYRTYHPNNSGLDDIRNAKDHNGKLVGVVTKNGVAVIQSKNDPAPGYYVSSTSYQNEEYDITNPKRYLDSETVNFIVVPSHFSKIKGILGCKAFVFNTKNGKYCEAIVGDYGPKRKIGEMSMSCAKAVGINPNPRIGGTKDKIIKYTIWPGITLPGFKIKN